MFILKLLFRKTKKFHVKYLYVIRKNDFIFINTDILYNLNCEKKSIIYSPFGFWSPCFRAEV